MDSLFDDGERTNTRPATLSESMFAHLNRTRGPVWERIRGLMDEWWNEHPTSAKANVRGQIRSGDNHAFMAAFFELYGYQVLRRVHDKVIEHPVTQTGRQPDFHATSDGADPLVLEMTSTGASAEGRARAGRRNTIYDQINSWSLPNFLLHVTLLSEGPGNPPLRRLRRELEVWIGSLDVEEIAALVAESSGGYLISESAPRYTWEEAGWSIEFGVFPRSPEKRGPRTQAIGLYGPDASWVNDVEPIRGRLADKASAYGDFHSPYVVAVLLGGMGSDDISVAAALYGDEVYTFPRHDPNAGQLGRRPNGSWYKPDGWHHTNVSAVLVASQLLPWTVNSAVPTLWHHPAARYPIDGIAPLFRQATPNPETGHINFAAPATDPATFFDLPPDWPGSEPRFD